MTLETIIQQLDIDYPILTSVRNGQTVTMSEEERQSTLMQWAQNMLDTPPVIPSPVQMWQVKVWLARKNIPLAMISQIISSKIPEGVDREEALIRWEYVTEVPFDNVLVGLIASELNISKETAWEEIKSI